MASIAWKPVKSENRLGPLLNASKRTFTQPPLRHEFRLTRNLKINFGLAELLVSKTRASVRRQLSSTPALYERPEAASHDLSKIFTFESILKHLSKLSACLQEEFFFGMNLATPQ